MLARLCQVPHSVCSIDSTGIHPKHVVGAIARTFSLDLLLLSGRYLLTIDYLFATLLQVVSST